MRLHQRLLAEALGTAGLLAVVVGSGIMAERLAGGNAAIALLANTLATVAGLYVLIELFAPVSGAHFNPAVSIALALRGALPRRDLLPYIGAQLLGAALGTWVAHAMFGLALGQLGARERSGASLWLAEVVATFALLLVVLRARRERVAAMVAAVIGAGYWYTASTSFANPAATFGRMLTDTYTGIAPASVAPFVVAQLIGAALALGAQRLLTDQRLSR
jgi:glycerol uptake facilitator-like aquaporin